MIPYMDAISNKPTDLDNWVEMTGQLQLLECHLKTVATVWHIEMTSRVELAVLSSEPSYPGQYAGSRQQACYLIQNKLADWNSIPGLK